MIRKRLSHYFILLIALIYTHSALAASLEGAAKNISKSAINIALACAGFGIAFGTVQLMLGKHEGREQIAKTVFGLSCCLLIPAGVSWLSTNLK